MQDRPVVRCAGSMISERVNLAKGFFKVQLDFGSASGGGKESWLGIALRPAESSEDYAVLSPRHRLTPTPYAILAQHRAVEPDRYSDRFR